MTTSYGFNWSWVADTASTKRASDVVHQGGGTIFSFRQAAGGAISSSDLSAFSKSVGQNLQSIRSDWRTYIRPILNSLPAGNNDQRWSTSTGKGLPAKIDCFTYGVQGSTLFVFNDASSLKADGRYWYTAGNRPKTIAEAFEDVYTAINDVSSTVSDTTSVDFDPLWAAVGEAYRDSSRVAAVGSLDTRVGATETHLAQLNIDIYEPSTYSYQLGTPLLHSVAKNIEALLQIHGVAAWQSDPTGASHSAISPSAHTHTYDEVLPMLNITLTQARTTPYTSLENEILRLRWEIQRTRGSSSWYSDATDPVTSSAGDLSTHMNYVGKQIPSASNPHGVNYTDTGADTVFDVVRSFTGMSNNADSSPTYSSTTYVTQSGSLETAIGELDAAVASVSVSTVVRQDYSYDRSSTPEHIRAQTPIPIAHNLGRKPIVEVLDTGRSDDDYWGIYISPADDVMIDHVDTNNVEVWTAAAKVEVIIIG
jgi:hypothetical protein